MQSLQLTTAPFTIAPQHMFALNQCTLACRCTATTASSHSSSSSGSHLLLPSAASRSQAAITRATPAARDAGDERHIALQLGHVEGVYQIVSAAEVGWVEGEELGIRHVYNVASCDSSPRAPRLPVIMNVVRSSKDSGPLGSTRSSVGGCWPGCGADGRATAAGRRETGRTADRARSDRGSAQLPPRTGRRDRTFFAKVNR